MKDWIFGHGKDIPEGMTADDVARIMRQYIVGEIQWDEYNELVPGR